MKKLYIIKEKLCIGKEKWHLKAIGFGKEKFLCVKVDCIKEVVYK